MPKKLTEYFEQNATRYEEELKELLRIPSVSTDEEHKPDMLRCANKLVEMLKDAGMVRAEVMETEGHPAVFAASEQLADRPTVLVYGHYDVQPEVPVELWESPPFEPEIRDGRIYARGTSDDKGQFFVHIKAAEAYHKLGIKLPVNLKYILEGEEEVGSPSLVPWINEHKDLLKCDVVVVSDSTLYAPGLPGILYALRGLAYLEVEYTSANTDLHSGMFGGSVANPAIELCKMLSQLIDDKGHITVPHFYDKVRELTPMEREAWAALPFDEKAYLAEIGAKLPCGEEGYTTNERRWGRPTLDINGLLSGFTGQGAKTVLPCKAMAKISCRLVPDQDQYEIAKLLEEEILRLTPPTVEAKITYHHGAQPWITDPNNPILEAARKAYRHGWNVEPVLMREGGSIGIVNDFTNALNATVLLLGIGLDNENIHAPNEFLTLANFHSGIQASAYLMNELGKLDELKRSKS